MPRYAPGHVSYQFGPGRMTPAIRAIIYSNIAVYVMTFVAPVPVTNLLGLRPESVIERGWVWQIATYLFVHAAPPDFFHILFNMLAVWMFGTDLERRWGTRAFVRYYAITGIGAGLCVILASLLPFEATQLTYRVPTVGASGAIYGLIVAWAVVFPDRQILFMLLFPISTRVNAMILAGIAFMTALGANTRVSAVAHLGGLVIGYFYLKGPKNPRSLRLEFQYRLSKWRMERMRRKFDVHRGGRVH